MRLSSYALFAVLLFGLGACSSTKNPRYFPAHIQPPTTILVLPPINNSNDERGTYSYLSTISMPLGEAGYYVLPVAVVDAYLKANGLPSPYEMHHTPINKYKEILGADAILYIEIDRYGQEYSILNSTTIVSAKAKLIQTDTGEEIWQGHTRVSESSDSSESITNALVNALVTQVVKANRDYAHGLSQKANWNLLHGHGGLPKGPNYVCTEKTCTQESNKVRSSEPAH